MFDLHLLMILTVCLAFTGYSHLEFPLDVHAGCSHSVFTWVFTLSIQPGVHTIGVHTGCSPWVFDWVFTLGVHTECSHWVFTIGVHTRGVHTGCSHWMFTLGVRMGVHTGCSPWVQSRSALSPSRCAIRDFGARSGT